VSAPRLLAGTGYAGCSPAVLIKEPALKRLMCVIAILGGGLLPATAFAAAPSERLVLDSYYDWSYGYTPPVSTTFKVAKHRDYVATVSGTFSFYPSFEYSGKAPGTLCGTPDPAAQYPGSLGGNGPTGFDAQFIFAEPSQRRCLTGHFPQAWSNFQMNSGRGWRHPGLLGPLLLTPPANHTYSYAIIGDGDRVQARLKDVYTRDNYGLLHILLRPARVSDCASYGAFGFTSKAVCATSVSR